MKFEEIVNNISNTIILKRLCSQYVIDYKNLDKEELKKALIKTAPQYYYLPNLKKVYKNTFYHNDRNVRILTPIFIKKILLNQPSSSLPQKELNEAIIKYEQEIIDYSNEGYIKNLNYKQKEIDLFRFILTTGWEQNNFISPDEKNLILKLKDKLQITDKEYQILEAELGKFPRNNNTIHTHDEINQVRKELQTLGLIFSYKSKDIVYDVIPKEMTETYRKIFNIELIRDGYFELINNKNVRNKQYLLETIKQSGLKFDEKSTLAEMQAFIVENIKPSTLLGGKTRLSGLSNDTLSKWCKEQNLLTSGTKQDLINRIIDFYDNVQFNTKPKEDERELYFQYYNELASRNLTTLRKNNIIEKDLECERKFEEATNYIFEKLLNHNPLTVAGNENPDGTLSYGNKLILWDNKSNESEVKLKDHIKQFDRYIIQSKKDVVSFIVIAPSFSDCSIEECVKYQLTNDTVITLITADELKRIAKKWKEKNEKTPFPLGYFKQPGIFNSNLIKL